MRDFDFRDVVLVADSRQPKPSSSDNAHRRDLEQTSVATLDDLRSAIESLGLVCHHYETPAGLASKAYLHHNDIVLSIYGGASSRSRMALTPAVCEAFGLRFIGPDAYGRIIAQDKELSKRLALDYGLLTPSWRVVRSEAELPTMIGLEPPIVVKPLLEGSSIGISSRSIQHTSKDASLVASELLQEFGQPIIAEHFVAGREVSYVRIESSEQEVWGLSEVVIQDDPDYYKERLFDANEKMIRNAKRTVRNIDNELKGSDRMMLDRFLYAFGRFGYCRVDGRLSDGRFHFIELTPDAWLGRHGQLAMAFTEKGWTYQEVLAAILSSVVPNPQVRLSNG